MLDLLTGSNVSVFLAVNLVGALVCWWHAVRHRRDLPNAREWSAIGADLETIHRSAVRAKSYSRPTELALEAVLTDQPGVVRRSEIPWALDVLEASIQRRVGATRAYGGICITVGLFTTVFLFKSVMDQLTSSFANEVVPRSGQMPLTGPDNAFANVFNQLSWVYLLNAFMIGVAIWMFGASIWIGKRGHAVVASAHSMLERLPDSRIDQADPQLVAAIEILQERQSAGTEQLLDRQLERVEAMLGQMTGLADGIREVVVNLASQAAPGPEQVVGPMRAVQATMEALHERLDDGLKQMVEPFAGGIPSVYKLGDAADALTKSVEGLRRADVVQAVGKIEKTAEALEAALTCIPDGIDGAIAKLGKEAPAALAEGLRTAVLDVTQDVGKKMTGAIVESQQVLARSVGRLAARIEAVEGVLANDRAQLPAAVADGVKRGLEDDLKRMASAVAAVPAAVEQLRADTTAMTRAATQLAEAMARLDAHLSDSSNRRRWF